MKLIILHVFLILFFIINNINATFHRPKKDDVKFFLYTRYNRNSPRQIWINDVERLRRSHYDSRNPTKIITHGWICHYKHESCSVIREAFMSRGYYNIIVIDWSRVAGRDYISAASQVKNVGAKIAKLINFLYDQGTDVNKMSLIGHSLGAHIVGSAGYQAKVKVGHIVGLDPAGPGYKFPKRPGHEIKKGDGRLVEIIHTNGGALGKFTPIGDVDYYPNGGVYQPGCNIDIIGVCSHGRAYEYYAESIKNPKKWLAVRCHSWVAFIMGFCLNNQVIHFAGAERATKRKGIYKLRTRSSSPYGLGKRGL